ncbi:LysM repeat protein [Haloferula luteola]|uniref:LysM repeat protein n=2 Tax=Haloferula luteola TaxID=595692 RepID=A0A840VHV6_9BACT|nr:LysM repeat protein [Haloferula luteola]
MRISPAWLLMSFIPWIFPSCSNSSLSGDNPSGTGPFDSRGNYVEAWADNPSKWNGRSVQPTEVASNESSNSSTVAQTTTVTTTPTAKPEPVRTVSTTSTPAPKPKPKPVVKPKPKPKPAFATHSVRKGDTLYGLAKRYGTTVGKIQQANGIKGSNIRIGQSLKIPR